MKMKKMILVACSLGLGAVGAVELPTMGWSSWNAFRVNISEEIICQQAQIMATNGLKAAGYRYVNIDDGYFGGRDADGCLVTHPVRFPNGLAATVSRIHQLGLLAGIYSDGGSNTCGSMFDGDERGRGVGFYLHDQQDADYFFRKLGFDFIKVDFCGGVATHNREGLILDAKERYTSIAHAIREAGGEKVRMNVCRWDYPGTWVRDVAVSWRMSQDIVPGWYSVTNIVAQNLFLSAYAGDGHYNDMDMLEINVNPRPNRPKHSRLTDAECATHFGLWCLMTSPLLLGCDLATLPPQLLALVTNPELIAVNQDPCSQQAYVVWRSDDGCAVLVKDRLRPQSSTRFVGLYNPTDEARELRVRLEDLDLVGPAQVRDLFAREDRDAVASEIVVQVPAHGLVLYALTGTRRLERSIYTAGTAYLSAYQELDPKAPTARYEFLPSTVEGSMRPLDGVWVTGLGCSSGNDLQWRKVWREKAGPCSLELFLHGQGRYRLQVNGVDVGGERTTGGVIPVTLRAGNNTIRLYHESAAMPAVCALRVSL